MLDDVCCVLWPEGVQRHIRQVIIILAKVKAREEEKQNTNIRPKLKRKYEPR